MTYAMNPQSCAYVASFGIEPNRIPLDGWDDLALRGPDAPATT